MPPVGKAQYLWGVGVIRRGAAALGLPPQLARLRRAGGRSPPAAAPPGVSPTMGPSPSPKKRPGSIQPRNRAAFLPAGLPPGLVASFAA